MGGTFCLTGRSGLAGPPGFDSIPRMETLNAAELLAALGHESRLSIFRLLVEAGPEGLNASAIGEQLGMAPATLSFHLAHLSRVGLICGQRESRFIHYSACFGTMDELIAFLTNNCCQGKACLPRTVGCPSTPQGGDAGSGESPPQAKGTEE